MSQKIYSDRTELEGVNLPSAGQTRMLVIDENKEIKSEAKPIITIKITVPANEFRECFSTPVQLIPAQGAGTVISVKGVTAFIDYGTTPYDFASGQPMVLYTGTNSAIYCAATAQNNFNVTADTYLGFNIFGSSIDSVNRALMLTASSDATQGDSPVTFIIEYSIHDFN